MRPPSNGGTYGGNGGINTNNTRFVANSFPENGTNTIGNNILTSLQGTGTGGNNNGGGGGGGGFYGGFARGGHGGGGRNRANPGNGTNGICIVQYYHY